MADLDEFVRGYVETALWTESIGDDFAAAHNAETGEDASGDCGLLDFGFSADDLAAESLESVRAECADFLAHHSADVDAYCETLGAWHGSDSVRGQDARYSALERAGGDFLLTRNSHGAGFWDRGLPDDLGRRLTDAAKAYGTTYLYAGDDGKVYAS